MAAPRRATWWFLLACLTVLAINEYTVIVVFVIPAPSTRVDWIMATCFAAPMTTLAITGTTMLIIRTFADVLATLRYIGRCITKTRRRRRNLSSAPPHTPPPASSAAYPSSCAGWQYPDSSYTSPPGKERTPL